MPSSHSLQEEQCVSGTLFPGCATPVEAGVAADLLLAWAEQHAMAPEDTEHANEYNFLDLEMCVGSSFH